MADPTIVLKILADVKKAVDGLGDVSKASSGVEKAFSSAAVPAAAALGTIAIGAAKVSKSASDLEQSAGAVESVFGDSSTAVEAFGKQSAKSVGLAQSEYQQMAAVVGAQLNAMGTDSDKLAGKTNDLIGIASDLSATFGGSTSDAVSAVGALLRGERDPIEKYGVSIKQVDVNARLAADGIVTAEKASKDLARAHKTTESAQKALAKAQDGGTKNQIAAAKAAYEQAKANESAAGEVKGLDSNAMKLATANATLALLTEQTSKQQGAFARETDTAAHAQQVASAQFEDASAALGAVLLPIIVTVTGSLGELAVIVRDNATAFQVIVGIVALVAAGILAVNVAFKVYRAATLAVTAAQWLLNAAMSANPIGLVVIAVAALAAGLVLLWTNSETFRKIVTTAFNAVLAVVQSVVAWITGAFGRLGAILSGPWTIFLAAVKTAVAGVRSVIDSLAKWIDGIFAGIRSAAKTVGDIVDSVNPFVAVPPAARTGARIVAGPWSRAAARSGGSSSPITVNVYTTGDSIEAEQSVVRAIRRAQRLNAGLLVPASGRLG